jgi:uncharacterized protein (DUF952 family)
MPYKLLTESEFNLFRTNGYFVGTSLDKKSGFIHMCETNEQVKRVYEKFYKGNLDNTYCLTLNLSSDKLKYEPISNGDIYPHLYNSDLQWSDVTSFMVYT